jgi:hypothetical protein
LDILHWQFQQIREMSRIHDSKPSTVG